MISTFHYKAIDHKGDAVSGTYDAQDSAEVIAYLHGKGWYPTAVTTNTSFLDEISALLQAQPRKKLGRRELVRLTQDLDTLLVAGLTLDQTLNNLAKRKQGFGKQLVDSLITDIKAGQPLSGAFARHPDSFDKFYVSVVKAGEASGNLAQALHRLSSHLEKRQTLRDALLGALLYPLLLLSITVLSLLFLLGYVIPRFAAMFEGSESVLPAISRFVFFLSRFFQDYWALLMLLVMLICAALPYLLKRNLGQVQGLLLKLPLIGKLLQANIAATFSRSMSTLLQSGLNPVESLTLAQETVSNVAFRTEVGRCIAEVKSGSKISSALAVSEILPRLASDLIAVGEETGQLPAMFARTADFYEKEAEQLMKKSLIVLEPVLIVGLGIMIAIVILSVLLAMLSVNDLVM